MSMSSKGSKKDEVGGGLVCAQCKKVGELDTMKRCGRCRLVCYCSVECQKLHWKSGGHKKVCGSGTSSDGAGVSGGGAAPLKHPCAICLDKEDDAGECALCYSCGQVFCGSCKKSLEQRHVANCPTCRAELRVHDEDEVRLLRQLLARSDGRHTQFAQYSIGRCYENGIGVVHDDAEAMQWYRLAADQGYAKAQLNLGVCYAKGTGVVHGDAEAVRWYRLAADQGYARAQDNLGVCYQKGTGIVQDEAEAVRWYRLAADQGFAKAQLSLGYCYEDGTGVAQDEAEAVRWYRLAADQGYAGAQRYLGGCFEHGIGVAEDEAEAVRWYHLSADQGHAGAQFSLGECYENGIRVAQDEAEAMRWYRLAADQGDANALHALARLRR